MRILLGAFFLLSVAARGQDPGGSIEGVLTEDGKFEREWGVWFKVDFQINECYGRECSILIWMYDEKGNPLKDRNGEYVADDGTVLSRQDFKPAFRYAKYTKLGLFLPYNELHLGPGRYNLQYKFGLYWRDSAGWHRVHVSGMYKYSFNWRIPESGEITKLWVDYNETRAGRNGINIHLNYSVHGMKGKKGRFIVTYYQNLSELHPVYRHGRESEGALSFTQEFSANWDDTNFTDGSYWVAYDEFPLKIGRNSFYYKVWLDGQSTDGNWYSLDSTSAKEIWVNNGELKLREVWVVDNQIVEVDWRLSREEARTLQATLEAFNRWLFDATDGQVRVAKFTIRGASRVHDHKAPILRFYSDFKNADHGDKSGWWEWVPKLVSQMRPFAGGYGSPEAPMDMHIPGSWLKTESREFIACTLVHEFGHAAFGLYDEYQDRSDGSYEILCAETEGLRRAWNTCIMASNSPLYREFCKPGTHHADANHPKLGTVDCYTKMQQAIQRAFGRALAIPETPVDGPTNAPAPRFEWP